MGPLVEELRAEYRALAVEWGDARDFPEDANRLFKAHRRERWHAQGPKVMAWISIRPADCPALASA